MGSEIDQIPSDASFPSEDEQIPTPGPGQELIGSVTMEYKIRNMLESALTSHEKLLERYLEEWSECQKKLRDSVLATLESHAKIASNCREDSRQAGPHAPTIFQESVPHSHFNIAPEPSNAKHARVSGGSEASIEGDGERKITQRSYDLVHNMRQSRFQAFRFMFTDEVNKRAQNSISRLGGLVWRGCIENLYTWRDEKFRASERFMSNEDKHGILVRLVLSNYFESVTAMAILANSLLIGYASDYAMKNLRDPTTDAMDFLELFFTLFYTAELILRVLALGSFFIFSRDWRWNLFDTLLVGIALADQIAVIILGHSGGNLFVLRLIRLQRMMRLARIFRILRMFRELRLILNQVVGSIHAMVWSVLLILIITYVIGIVIVQASTAALMDDIDKPGSMSQSGKDGIKKYWDSLIGAMLSLYSSTTGGEDWMHVAESLKAVGTSYHFLFLLYIAFFLFVIVNTLTSLFVGTAMKNAERDQDSIIAEEMRRKGEYIRKIKSIFQSIAKEDQKTLTKDDFDMVLQDRSMIAWMSSLEIEPVDVEHFFHILSSAGEHEVDIDTFVVGCMKLRGPARSMDLLGLINCVQADSDRIKKIERDLGAIRKWMARYSQAFQEDITKSQSWHEDAKTA